MKTYSIIDLTAYLVLKLLGPLVRLLPRPAILWAGRRLGELWRVCDRRHSAIVYANLYTAFGHRCSPSSLAGLVTDYYRSLCQNILEIFLIPSVDRSYVERHVSVKGRENADNAFSLGKGVIFCGVHAGNWELSGIISAGLGYPYGMLVRDQRMKLCGRLLTGYRRKKGCRVLDRDDELRQIISLLKANGSVGMSIDQGGADGVRVSFFGTEASMAQGAVRLALKLGCSLVPVFCSRLPDSRLEFNVHPAMPLTRSGDIDADVRENLQRLVRVFERHIEERPQEYLWSYKVWKHGRDRRIVIISDGITGHLRQSQALAGILSRELTAKGLRPTVSVLPLAFKNPWRRKLILCPWFLSGPHICRGCLRCLSALLTGDCYRSLLAGRPDFIVSCGSSAAPVSYLLSLQGCARPLVIMKPPWHWDGLKRFALCVIARHDNPPAAENVAVTEGALNLVEKDYLDSQRKALEEQLGFSRTENPIIGLLVGGNTKKFRLTPERVSRLAEQVLDAAERLDARVMVTTSRRTPAECERMIRDRFRASGRCAVLILANEKNYEFAVGGILGSCSMAVCTPESVSMLSEAASSGVSVFTFAADDLGGRHRVFLRNLSRGKHIHCPPLDGLAVCLTHAQHTEPLDDGSTVARAVRKHIV